MRLKLRPKSSVPGGKTGGWLALAAVALLGAREVSSGVTLPPVPPITGNRKNPVPS